MLPTAQILDKEKYHVLKRLNVGDFHYDNYATMRRDPDVTQIDSRNNVCEFRCPVVSWKIDGKWYKGAVPIVIREGIGIFGTTLMHDEFAMEHELIAMIERSRRIGADDGSEMGQKISGISKAGVVLE